MVAAARPLTDKELLYQFGPERQVGLMSPQTEVMYSLRRLAENRIIKAIDIPSYYSPHNYELTARFCDVAHLIKTGDGAWYRGVKPWSLAIRIGTQSMVSHGGILGIEGGEVRLIDTCEGIGCRNRSFEETIEEEAACRWRGQWYWGPVADLYREDYDEETAWKYAKTFEGAEYGHYAIIGMAMWHLPVLRILAFMCWGREMEADWVNFTPFCSMLQCMITGKGLCDPVPDKALQLTSPQDTWQSLFWGPKIGLTV